MALKPLPTTPTSPIPDKQHGNTQNAATHLSGLTYKSLSPLK